MPEKHRGIGSEGLEQGGPDLGNDYTRPIEATTIAGDALVLPKEKQKTPDSENDTLNMDKEINRNLTTGEAGTDNYERNEDLAEGLELDDEDLEDLDDDDFDEEDDII